MGDKKQTLAISFPDSTRRPHNQQRTARNATMGYSAVLVVCIGAALAVLGAAQPTDQLYMPHGSTDIWAGKPSTTHVWQGHFGSPPFFVSST